MALFLHVKLLLKNEIHYSKIKQALDSPPILGRFKYAENYHDVNQAGTKNLT
jgi:hypothetical protein